jgi:hypothetical protein
VILDRFSAAILQIGFDFDPKPDLIDWRKLGFQRPNGPFEFFNRTPLMVTLRYLFFFSFAAFRFSLGLSLAFFLLFFFSFILTSTFVTHRSFSEIERIGIGIGTKSLAVALDLDVFSAGSFFSACLIECDPLPFSEIVVTHPIEA